MQFIKLWCEYDFGQDEYMFDNEDDAEAWLWERMLDSEGESWVKIDMGFKNARSIFEEGLAGYSLITLWEQPK